MTYYKTIIKEQLADLHTPVGIYLQLRDRYSELLLLESNDYQSREDSYSFICAEALATISAKNGQLTLNGDTRKLQRADALTTLLADFTAKLSFSENVDFNGLYGHCNFDAVQYFDSPELDAEKRMHDLPDLRYSLYRFVIAIHHFTNRMYILENIPEGETSKIGEIEAALQRPASIGFPFSLEGAEQSPLTDEQFREMVVKAKGHCARGDVFQLVLSRRFSQGFSGDEFNVYRALRSINPSPYLFYFDYGTYKLFGSSPEAQLVIRDQKASLNPIAGTYKRSGDVALDKKMSQALLQDPKENAEHVMLVDLARNDLNRHAQHVQVSQYKQLQQYSHVIHIVSKVDGELGPEANPYQVFGDTFPAGTLSGAPKYKALELIDRYELHQRGFYGGAIGFFAFNGNLNQAILIRSFMSYQQQLHYQAGAGIVIDSDPEKELQEIYHKLGALKKALQHPSSVSYLKSKV